jgi:hypothetical protein
MASSRFGRRGKGKPPAAARHRETRAEREERLRKEAEREKRRIARERAKRKAAREAAAAEAERLLRVEARRKRREAERRRVAAEERAAEKVAAERRRKYAEAQKRRRASQEPEDEKKREAKVRKRRREAARRKKEAAFLAAEVVREAKEQGERGGRPPKRKPGKGETGKAIDRANADLVLYWLRDLFRRVAKKLAGKPYSTQHLYAGDRTVEASVFFPPPPRGKKLRAWLTEISDAFEADGPMDRAMFYADTYWQVRLRFVGFNVEGEPDSPGDDSRIGEEGERYETYHSHWFVGRFAAALVTMEEMYPLIRKSLGPDFKLFRVSIHAHWNPKGLRPDRASGVPKG